MCFQIRFHYHMYGPHCNSLTLFVVQHLAHQKVKNCSPHQEERTGTLYSFGDKGDQWYREVVPLPNITHRYFYYMFHVYRIEIHRTKLFVKL